MEKISGMHNTTINVCGAYNPANTCAKINMDGCIPQPIFGSKSTSSISKSENMFDQLAKENKKLTQEKIKLNLKILELQKQNYNLTQDNLKYKIKAEKEKGKVWKDLNKSIKSIYQKIIDWFNS